MLEHSEAITNTIKKIIKSMSKKRMPCCNGVDSGFPMHRDLTAKAGWRPMQVFCCRNMVRIVVMQE